MPEKPDETTTTNPPEPTPPNPPEPPQAEPPEPPKPDDKGDDHEWRNRIETTLTNLEHKFSEFVGTQQTRTQPTEPVTVVVAGKGESTVSGTHSADDPPKPNNPPQTQATNPPANAATPAATGMTRRWRRGGQ